jgi:hypothetical protein
LHEVDDTMALKRAAGIAKPKMKRKAYEKELRKLQVELCHLQDWVKQTGARIIIVFEGRDAAGKGGTIKAPRRYCFGLRIPKGSPPIGRATGKMPAAGLGLRSKRSPTMDRRRRSSNASTACWRTPLATTGMVHGAAHDIGGERAQLHALLEKELIAAAPPSSVMKSCRFNWSNCIRTPRPGPRPARQRASRGSAEKSWLTALVQKKKLRMVNR